MKHFSNIARFFTLFGFFLATAAPALAADSTPPVVSAVSPTMASQGTTISFSATYSDQEFAGEPLPSCNLSEGGVSLGAMTVTGTRGAGTATLEYAFSTAGTHHVYAQCADSSFNAGTGPTTDVTVPTPGTVGSVSPMAVNSNVATTFSASYNGFNAPYKASECTLVVDGSSVAGTMTLSGGAGSVNGTASKSYTFTTLGAHTMWVSCLEEGGTSTFRPGPSVSVNVTAAAIVDTTAPSVGIISQTSASVGSSIVLSATYSDNVGVTSCDLYVNGVLQGSMSLSGGTATRANTFGSVGNYNVSAQCRDAAGYSTSGAVRVISVTSSTPTPGLPPYGSLMKLICPAGAGVNHACKAIYYYGSDNRRHAFPNEKVYFTWYSNFSGVVEVSDAAMASVLLGRNATYRPGIKMVKFTTLNKVYAVGRSGLLRWVTTQELAQSFYGSNWNRQIDDISDAFFPNYTFGLDITSTSQYNPSGEAAAATTVDQSL